jgi:hypothetical protein
VSLPPLKPRIATVAFSANGVIDAFTSKGGVLSDYALGISSKVWKLAQKARVDLYL